MASNNNSSRSHSKPHALAVPLPFQGHIHPLLQLSKRLVSAGFMVTFANTEAIHKRIQDSSNQKEEEEEGDLHLVSLEEGIPAEVADDVFAVIAEVLKPAMCHAVARLLARLCEKDPPVTLLVFDLRLTFLLDLAVQAGIPTLSFWPQSAASFLCNLVVAQGLQRPADDLTFITCVDGVPPFKRLEVTGIFVEQVPPPFPALAYAWEPFKRIHEPNWVALNTFEELEATTMNTLQSCLGFRPLALGPLVDASSFSVVKDIKEINNAHSHIEWLQNHPQESVLYVSFGTVVKLSEEQLEELVIGLEASQQPILWVFRPQVCENSHKYTLDTLSTRFMNQGLVVDWASQLQVLMHSAVGGFFTHCGWNSTLESIIAGVPMLGWPGLSDQFLNKRCIEDQWRIGLGFEVDVSTKTFITRDEIQKSVKRLMQGPKAKEMREKTRNLSNLARLAIEEEGSSYRDFAYFDTLS